jgi:hypothetical protein
VNTLGPTPTRFVLTCYVLSSDQSFQNGGGTEKVTHDVYRKPRLLMTEKTDWKDWNDWEPWLTHGRIA